MAFGNQASVDVDGDSPAELRALVFQKLSTHSRSCESEVLIIDDFCYRERVVNLSHMHLVWFDIGHLVCRLLLEKKNIETCQRTFSSSKRHGARSQAKPGDPHGSIGNFSCFFGTGYNQTGRPVSISAAVV